VDDATKTKIFESFVKKIEIIDLDPKIRKIINENFTKLIDDKVSTESP
jgi:hypothetical protein